MTCRWICGGVPVNYHALNDFRSGAGNDAVMDEAIMFGWEARASRPA